MTTPHSQPCAFSRILGTSSLISMLNFFVVLVPVLKPNRYSKLVSRSTFGLIPNPPQPSPPTWIRRKPSNASLQQPMITCTLRTKSAGIIPTSSESVIRNAGTLHKLASAKHHFLVRKRTSKISLVIDAKITWFLEADGCIRSPYMVVSDIEFR